MVNQSVVTPTCCDTCKWRHRDDCTDSCREPGFQLTGTITCGNKMEKWEAKVGYEDSGEIDDTGNQESPSHMTPGNNDDARGGVDPHSVITNKTTKRGNSSMNYSVKKLSDGLVAAKAATVAAIEKGNKDAAEAVHALAKAFLANGGAPRTTPEPVLIGAATVSIEEYDRLIAKLGLLAGDQIEDGELTDTCVRAIEAGGNVTSLKRTVSIR